MLTEFQKSQGSVKIATIDNYTGKIIKEDAWKNTITTAGKDFLATYLVNASPAAPFMNYIQGGTHGTTVYSNIAIGATSIEVVADILSGSTGSIVLNPGPNPASPNSTTEVATVSAKSGTGPYTYTIGATTYAHNSGEPVVLETLVTDTALGTASGSAVLGTQTATGNAFSTVSTLSAATNTTLYEFGLFSGSGGSGTATMYSHITTSSYVVGSTNSLTITWQITYL